MGGGGLMAQPRADRPQLPNMPDPVTVPGKALLPPAGESVNDLSSIDKLLAMTDEPWDIGEQVRSLQIAADEQPRTHADGSPASMPPAKARVPALMLPTPFELAPAQNLNPSVAARRAQEFPVASPSQQPPPLPPKPSPSLSKGPPPLPRSADQTGSQSKMPPLPPPRSPDQTGGARRSFPSLPDQTGSPARRPSIAESAANPGALGELLLARISTLEPTDDKVGLARAHIEMAVASETVLADDARAIVHAEAALRIDPRLAAAHAILRRRKHGRAALGAMLAHLDHELSASTAEAATLELLVEKARLLDAMGEQPDSVRAVWEQALTRAPRHAASLKGLEGELTSRANQGSLEAHEALAYHLAQMADAYHSEPRLAAWLHVERAFILEWRLRKLDAARGALERAVELDASVGPVRDALVRHLAAHNDAVALVLRLNEEATIEIDPFRAARLLLDAAIIANERLRDTPQAIELLTRAARHAPTMPTVDRRVLDELVRLHEAMAEWPEAVRARRARLHFFNDPEVLGYEFLALARINERLEEIDDAIADVEQALAIDPNDASLLDMLDRLLATAGKDEQRVNMWVSEASRLEEDATKRARALGKAAHIAENILARPNDAIRHLRGAWIAAPGDAEVLDALARLLAPSPSERADGEARALIDLYAQAVECSRDNGRKVAYLEKIALIWEELIGDSRRAARAFEEILLIEPDRRGAVLGLARNAARTGDERALSRALLDEARLAGDGVGVLTLRTRAASALARIDPARALSLVDDVLEHDGAHPVARALETRLHEEAGRWDRAAESLTARIGNASQPREKLSLYLSLSQIQDKKLRSPTDALRSLQAAHALDPTHPVPPEEIARMLEASGDHKTLRTAIETLAKDSTSPDDRLRFLVRAAEIDELRLGDDVRAAEIYTRALRESPDDELIAERLARVLARQAATAARAMDSPESARTALAELASLQAQRIGRSPDGALARALSFDLALILVELGRDLPHAVSLLESVLAEDPAHHPSLRALEAVARKTGEWASLANTLSRQAEAFQDVRARLGSLWGLAALEEWRLPVGDTASTYSRILQLDPTDPAALEATVRRDLPNARRGEPRSRKAVIGALRALFVLASDDGTRLAIQLRLALILEGAGNDTTGEATSSAIIREANDRYRAALHLDELSVTAATGLARTATRLHDTEGAVAAAVSLADLSAAPTARARYLIDAAELLLGPDRDERLGKVATRRTRAGELLEKALDADADSLPAAARLSSVRVEDHEGERLLDTFRGAIKRARTPDAIVLLGTEIARVARDELRDLTVAIDAMRRVREAAPQHVPSLLTLSELCIAQRSWPEAVNALEAVVALGREAAPRLTALFALASIYERVLARPVDAEGALRAALAIDQANPRALRALIRHLTTHHSENGALKPECREEVAELLERLSVVERDPDQKCELLLELAELRGKLGDLAAVERTLVEAVAQTPGSGKAFNRLSQCFGAKGGGPAGAATERGAAGRDDASFARALGLVIARGQQLGKVHAAWLASLGQIEIESLGKLREGIGHYQQAVKLDPGLYETRYELARAYAKAGAHEDCSRQLLSMLLPVCTPLLEVKGPAAALTLLEQSLSSERRAEEALVVSELRAMAGELDNGRLAWLRQRRLGQLEPHHAQLDRPSIVTHVLPPEGRHVMLEIAAAVAGMESKILRADLTEIGISLRDRVSPRSGHPTRALLERLCRTLGLADIELVIAQSVTRTRVLALDELWVVVPQALTQLPEPTQLASLARALTRISLGVPWVEELPPPHIEAMLIACARQVVHGYGADELDVLSQKLVAQYEPNVARALGRRQRKLLEELAPHIGAPQGRPIPIDTFIGALAQAEVRAASLLTGDLLATLDEMRALDAPLFHATEVPGPLTLKAVLEHPFAGDVCRFALSGEAMALRRRIGTSWTG